jgi:putative peptidoglycan lipid II flippase
MVLAITQLLASVAGLIRDRVLASTFPPGLDALDTVSVYIAAFRPSDFFFQMFVMSAFSVALVPLLAGHLAHGKKEEMDRLLTSTLIVSHLFFGILVLVLVFFFDTIAPYLVDFTGERLELYIHFGRLACFTNFLFVSGNAFGQYLITKQTYWAYGITPILYTAGTIIGTIFFTPIIGVYGPLYGSILGALVYIWVRAGAVLFGGFSFRVSKASLFHPELLDMWWLMLPRMMALGAVQGELLLFDKVASGLASGSVTINAYARNFQSAVVGVIGIALAQSAFSLLSQVASQGDMQRFRSYLRKGTLLVLGLSIPASLALFLLGGVAANIVHLIVPQVIMTFILTLGIYAISIPFENLNHLLLRASYATKHTTLPAIASMVNGFSAIAYAWIFAPTQGVYALAGGFLVGQVLHFIVLGIFLKVRLKVLDVSQIPASA